MLDLRDLMVGGVGNSGDGLLGIPDLKNRPKQTSAQSAIHWIILDKNTDSPLIRGSYKFTCPILGT